MSSIRNALVSLDTNIFVFALRRDALYPACERLVYENLEELTVLIPLEVHRELQHNLSEAEKAEFFQILSTSSESRIDYAPADSGRLSHWQTAGAKKSDAVIIAQLEKLGVTLLISENRHFLLEIPELPFEVITAQQALERLS